MATLPSPTRHLRHTYGGRRAWLTHLQWRTALATGRLRRYEAIDWGRVARVVFVCTGNICRSAYAEAKARRLGLPADSFGLAATPGQPADAQARRRASARSVDLHHHRSRAAADVSCDRGDLLVAMEPIQAEKLTVRAGDAQITLLGLWAQPQRPYLHDPYGLGAPYFDQCFDVIDTAIDTLRRQLTIHGATICHAPLPKQRRHGVVQADRTPPVRERLT